MKFCTSYKFLLIIIFWQLSVCAQWSPDPSINTEISTAMNGQYFHRMIPDDDGGAIITWQDSRKTNTLDIYAQRINSAGVVQWTTDGVPVCTDTMNQSQPQITSDGSGGAIITWSDYRNRFNNDIYAQRINKEGVVLWQTNGVPVYTGPRSQDWPSLVSDDSGGAIIFWQDEGTSFDTEDIFAQRINSAGAVQWALIGVPVCKALGGQEQPKAVSDGSGGAIITWLDERIGINNMYDIYAQHINAAGVVQWTVDGIPVSAAANTQVDPVIISDGVSGAIVTWLDHRNLNNPNLYTQRISGTGNILWDPDGAAVTMAPNLQAFATAISDGDSGVIIAWEDYRSSTHLKGDIYVQRINAAGEAEWTTDGVLVCTDTMSQTGPMIASDGANGAIVGWRDDRLLNNSDIYAQRIDNQGIVQWNSGGIMISSAVGYQTNVEIISNNDGGAILAFKDERSSTTFWDIYAQQVNADGSLGTVTNIDDQSKNVVDFALEQNYPNPFNPVTVITYHLQDAGFVNLKIYDVIGTEIEVLVNEIKAAGKHEAVFSGSHLTSGVYFYQLLSGSVSETKKMVLTK